MKHSYTITGMTCDNCEQKITAALLAIPEITEVVIDRSRGVAEISMSSHVQTQTMQSAIEPLGAYHISMDTEASMHSMKKSTNHIKDLVPLFVIIGILIVLSVLTTVFMKEGSMFGMRIFMGGFFLSFGLLKVIKLDDFAVAYKEYDILAMRSTVYAYAYPFIELSLGVLYLTNTLPFFTNVVTVIVMGIGAIGVYLKLKKKEEIPCACLGTVFKVPMTWVTLAEDLLMVFMALFVLLFL